MARNVWENKSGFEHRVNHRSKIRTSIKKQSLVPYKPKCNLFGAKNGFAISPQIASEACLLQPEKVLGTWDLTNNGTAVVLAAKLRPNAASVSTQFKGPGQIAARVKVIHGNKEGTSAKSARNTLSIWQCSTVTGRSFIYNVASMKESSAAWRDSRRRACKWK